MPASKTPDLDEVFADVREDVSRKRRVGATRGSRVRLFQIGRRERWQILAQNDGKSMSAHMSAIGG